jgi:hypothetical protein
MIGVQNMNLKETVAQGKGILAPLQQFILEHFGQNGLYAAYLLTAALAALFAYKILKLSFEIVLFVLVPSAISAFLLTYVLPYDFSHLLPATAALFTLGLVLRHVAFAKA